MKHILDCLNEWTSYNRNMRHPLSSLLAGSPDNAMPTNEDLLTDDCLSLIQQAVREAQLPVERGIEEVILKQAIRWYIDKCGEKK